MLPVRMTTTLNNTRNIPRSADEQESLAQKLNMIAKFQERHNRALMYVKSSRCPRRRRMSRILRQPYGKIPAPNDG